MSSEHELWLDVKVPINFHHLNFESGKEKPLLIFFHGFADNAFAFMKRAYPSMNEKFEILAINGPYPVPHTQNEEWKKAFAWYFLDPVKRIEYVTPKTSVDAIYKLLHKLELMERKKVLIGFSQGAMLIARLLKHLKNVEHVFCIGSTYGQIGFKEDLKVPMDAIHGLEDPIFDIKKAKESFEAIRESNPKGIFKEFPDMQHKISPEASLWLTERIEQVFK